MGPEPDKITYVYEVPADNFIETSEKHQWISKEKVPILKLHVFKAKDLKDYWRFATEEEFNLRWKKFGYSKPYKEFFRNRSHEIR